MRDLSVHWRGPSRMSLRSWATLVSQRSAARFLPARGLRLGSLAPCRNKGSGAPRDAGACEAPGVVGETTPGTPCEARRLLLRSRRRASRRSTAALATARKLAWRSSGPRFLGRGLSPNPSPAGSLQTGPSAGRAEPRSRPSARLRASPAGAAPAPSFERLRKTPLGEQVILGIYPNRNRVKNQYNRAIAALDCCVAARSGNTCDVTVPAALLR